MNPGFKLVNEPHESDNESNSENIYLWTKT